MTNAHYHIAGQRLVGQGSLAAGSHRKDGTGWSLPHPVLFGIAFVSIIPALFWTSVLWGAIRLAGSDLHATTATLVAAAIALFLSVVCSMLIAVN